MKKPHRPPDFATGLARIDDPGEFAQIVSNARPLDPRGRYLHWDDMRNRTPPSGLNHDEWWLSTKIARQSISRTIPLNSVDGRAFQFSNVDSIQEAVHRIDQQASGQILADEVVTSLRASDRYLVSSLAEEAITSSQLEGAGTTRQAAKELLATGRQPRDRSEQMILNNYQAMVFAQDLADSPLTPSDVLDLHRMVCEEALDDSRDAGHLQTSDDVRVSVIWKDNTVLHTPPPVAELPHRLAEMCRFANDDPTQGFIHPVVRSIILHFWLAYDHPFADGNGRTARALFYWSMLRHDYWLAQYLSVSSVLRKAPSKYARSYLLTETDDNDLTYFILYQLGIIERSIEGLEDYLSRKMAETREIEARLRGSSHLNPRQMIVVGDALRDPAEQFTIAGQARRNGVTYQSARTDLLGLEELGLFSKSKVGKKFVFRAGSDLDQQLRRLGT